MKTEDGQTPDGGTAEGTPDGGTSETGGESTPPEVNNNLSRRNDKLANENRELRTQLKDLQAFKADFESKAKAQEEERAKKAGEHEKIIADRDTQIAQLTGELTSMKRKAARSLIVDQIMTEATAEKRLVSAALNDVAEELGIHELEDPTEVEAASKKALKKLTKVFPRLFEPQGRGGTPGNAAASSSGRGKSDPFGGLFSRR